MAMVYAWMDKEEQFARHLNFAKQLIQAMEDNADQEEEIPLVRGRHIGYSSACLVC